MSVVGRALVTDTRALLVHRCPGRGNHRTVGAYPGHVEPGESVEDAARRECLEQLGIGMVDASRFPRSCSNTRPHEYAFPAIRRTGEPSNMAPDEHDDLGWSTTDDLTPLRSSEHAALMDLVDALRDVRRIGPTTSRVEERTTGMGTRASGPFEVRPVEVDVVEHP